MSSIFTRSASKGLHFWNPSIARATNAVRTSGPVVAAVTQANTDHGCNFIVVNKARHQSTAAAPSQIDDDPASIAYGSGNDGLGGDLFHADVGPTLLGKCAWIRRTFNARSNASSLLTCGGEELAKHASFDPEYKRAKDWIRQHAVGPAVLSPVLINGLVGALVEASVPQSIPVSSSMNQIRPLIVGVQVCAKLEVISVCGDAAGCDDSTIVKEVYKRTNGYEVQLRTEVTRMRDGAEIAQGSHTIWVPDYLRM